MGQVRILLTEWVSQVSNTSLCDLETLASDVGQRMAQQALSATVATVAPAYPAPRGGAEAVYQRQQQKPITFIIATRWPMPPIVFRADRSGEGPRKARASR